MSQYLTTAWIFSSSCLEERCYSYSSTLLSLPCLPQRANVCWPNGSSSSYCCRTPRNKKKEHPKCTLLYCDVTEAEEKLTDAGLYAGIHFCLSHRTSEILFRWIIRRDVWILWSFIPWWNLMSQAFTMCFFKPDWNPPAIIWQMCFLHFFYMCFYILIVKTLSCVILWYFGRHFAP